MILAADELRAIDAEFARLAKLVMWLHSHGHYPEHTLLLSVIGRLEILFDLW